MSDGTRNTVASTIFQPGKGSGPVPLDPCYMNNFYGTVDHRTPDHIGVGRYVVFMNKDVDPFRTSISHHACSDQATRDVSVLISRNTPSPDITRVDISIRENVTDQPTDDFIRCEVSFAQLPL
jgi:hypothetical protein